MVSPLEIMMNTFLKDLKYGVRVLLKSRGFAFAAIIALALGIGANTAIFSVVNTVLLRSLPYQEPDRLMVVRETKLPKHPEFSVSPGNYLDWVKQQTVFERLEARSGIAYNMSGGGEPERVIGSRVTWGTFSMLGAAPERGRDFLAEEDRPGNNNVVILSHGLWQRRFGGNPDIINQTITLDLKPYTVVGVMPPDFRYPTWAETELWSPIGFDEDDAQAHGAHYLSVAGRLKPGVTAEQAGAEMATIAARLAEQYPDSNTGWSTKVVSMQDYEVADIKPTLVFLWWAVALVLLVACANVANLLLARATVREKEFAIRTALGAGRGRIIRQLLTESLLLALIGGGIGLLLAVWGIEALIALAPEDLPRVKEVAIDSTAILFTLGVSVVTGLVFGLAPALQSSRFSVSETLKEGGRGASGGPRRQRIRNVLVVAEVSLALVLLVGAGLMIRSFLRLQQVDPGFNPRNALMASVSLSRTKYANSEQRAAFHKAVTEKLSSAPGVTAAGVTQTLPMWGDYLLGFHVQGRPPANPGEETGADYCAVTPGYFDAMGIRLVRGRLFTEQDREGAPRVALVSEQFARMHFPGEDPIGQSIHITNGPTAYREIVGIVGDVKQLGLAQETRAQMYEPLYQQPHSFVTLVVRTEGSPEAAGSLLRAAVFEVDKDQPLSRIRTLEYVVAGSIARQRFAMMLFGIFAVAALVLAAVGLYGVMSYSVTQRTHEIGIRMALGADRKDILRLVVGQGMILSAIGVIIGLAGAYLLGKLASSFLSGLLFQVAVTDLLTFIVIPVVLVGVALAASFVPARRAIKVDPVVALRHE
jgi:putative ABC transport system permease protein